jgi:hypothetical protein
MSISSLLRGRFYEQIFTFIGVGSIIGYSTYIISHYEERKAIKTQFLHKEVQKNFKDLSECNQWCEESERDPEKLVISGNCIDLYMKYKESYKKYMQNKYNIVGKYMA